MKSAKARKLGVLVGSRVTPVPRAVGAADAAGARAEYPVCASVAAALRAARALGLAPLALRPAAWRCTAAPARAHTLYCWALYTAISIILFLGFMYDLFAPKHDATTAALWLLNAMLTFSVIIVGGFGSPRRMKSLLSYITEAEKINEKFGYILITKARAKRIRVMLTFTVSSAICLFMYNIFTAVPILSSGSNNWNPLQSYVFVNSYVRIITVNLLNLQTLLVIKCILWTFRALNETLKTLIRQMELDKSVEWKPYSIKVIRNVTEGYVAARSLARQMNKSEGKTLLVLFTNFNLGILNSAYSLFSTKRTTDIWDDAVTYTLRMSVCLYLSACLIVLVEPCHETHKEMEETRELAAELTSAARARGPPAAELRRLLHQLDLGPRLYSPLALCSFSRALYAAVFGGTATYLVIFLRYL